MKKRTITIDELLEMPISELNHLLEDTEQTEGESGYRHIDIDMKGMTIEEIAKRNGYRTIDEVFNDIRRKLSEAGQRSSH